MLVSRKYLSLIHLVTGELAASVHMAEAVVKLSDIGGAHATGPILNEPFTESINQVPVLAASNFTGAFNIGFGSTKSDVFRRGLFIFRSSRRA